MLIYRVKYTESKSDIQNSNFFYKNTKKCQNTFEVFKNSNIFKQINFLFCIMYKLYNSYFVILGIFGNVVILGFWDFGISIYIHVYVQVSLCRGVVVQSWGYLLRQRRWHQGLLETDRPRHILCDTNLYPKTYGGACSIVPIALATRTKGPKRRCKRPTRVRDLHV